MSDEISDMELLVLGDDIARRLIATGAAVHSPFHTSVCLSREHPNYAEASRILTEAKRTQQAPGSPGMGDIP